MKKIIREILVYSSIMMAALLLSLEDFAWPAEIADCKDSFKIVKTEIDQDGNTLFSIYVNEIDGTDAECTHFGKCVYSLIATAQQMGAVEIMNFEDRWIPSIWQWIDSYKASILANPDIQSYEPDYEELAYMATYEWDFDYDD